LSVGVDVICVTVSVGACECVFVKSLSGGVGVGRCVS
jgi:hypothetical protein